MTGPHTPELPTFGPRDPIPSGPITCVRCGQPLELTCAGGCADSGSTKPKTPRTYRPKACACGASFTPTGPRDVRCSACKSGRSE